ncbi:MFS transporter [Frankia sp. R82]|uniref:MFS transporter n=1 Tax=Frankia sp. R82 TaxID=2950553 RepID=UPI0020431DDD|nr:MFS transporter [Frankia sp. R82]MCM3883815.1 MFS transporter [Frankia sp. R82]
MHTGLVMHAGLVVHAGLVTSGVMRMVWQLLVWGTAAATAGALAAACRPAAAAARRHVVAPGTAAAATGALVVLAVTGLALSALGSVPAWAGACWLSATAGAAGWIALRRQDPAVWGLVVEPLPVPASAAVPGPAAEAEPPPRMRPDLAAQDDLVQSLTIASYALQMGDARRAHQAVEAALSRSRATLDVLLREDPGRRFVRAAPAAASRPTSPNRTTPASRPTPPGRTSAPGRMATPNHPGHPVSQSRPAGPTAA